MFLDFCRASHLIEARRFWSFLTILSPIAKVPGIHRPPDLVSSSLVAPSRGGGGGGEIGGEEMEAEMGRAGYEGSRHHSPVQRSGDSDEMYTCILRMYTIRRESRVRSGPREEVTPPSTYQSSISRCSDRVPVRTISPSASMGICK